MAILTFLSRDYYHDDDDDYIFILVSVIWLQWLAIEKDQF